MSDSKATTRSDEAPAEAGPASESGGGEKPTASPQGGTGPEAPGSAAGFSQAEASGAAAQADAARLAELTEKAEKADLYLHELLKSKADLDNYQKRVQRERPNWEGAAVRSLVRDLLPVLDNFERAIESSPSEGSGLLDGVRMILQLLRNTLEDHGVREVDALGKPFDPELHEAITQRDVEDRETGEVLEVHQKGYIHQDVLVRPSRVVVAKRVSKSGDSASSEAESPSS